MMDGKNRTCVITGASAGIGKATAVEMARLGYGVVMLVRDSDKSRLAAVEIEAESGSDDLRMIYVDLASRESIVRAADEMKRTGLRIDVLVNNAGVYKRTREMSSDGIEMTLAVNFAAPFLLTNLLLPLMADNGDARIVNLTSALLKNASLVLDDQPSVGKFNGSKAYANSKMLVAIFTFELSRRLHDRAITANCLHPGVVGTDVFREYPKWFASAVNLFISKPEDGAKPVVYLATSPEVADMTGAYFDKTERDSAMGGVAEAKLGTQVWEYGERLTGIGDTAV